MTENIYMSERVRERERARERVTEGERKIKHWEVKRFSALLPSFPEDSEES